MINKLLHLILHPPQHNHKHFFIEGSMLVDKESGTVSANYHTICPVCGYRDKTFKLFYFFTHEEITMHNKLADKLGTEPTKLTTLEEAMLECRNFKG